MNGKWLAIGLLVAGVLVGGTAYALTRGETVKPVLKIGSKGKWVTAMQQHLVYAGYSLSTDGVFGQGTHAVLQQFQRAMQLPATGICDAATWNALAPDVPTTVAASNRIARARHAIGKGIRYRLGAGGNDPRAPLPAPASDPYCDCSGFVAWIMGVARSANPKYPKYIHTDAIWTDARTKQSTFRRIARPIPGCFAVYPDRNGREGHTGLVSSAFPLTVIDCGSGPDGISERSGNFFVGRPDLVFCVLTSDQLVA
jgi:hypothetical protein